MKRFGGTVGLSSGGMFGTGGGWGIVTAPPTLMVVLGGIAHEQRLLGGQSADRHVLHVTPSFDHAVVDGAPAARFAAGCPTRPAPTANFTSRPGQEVTGASSAAAPSARIEPPTPPAATGVGAGP